MIRKIMLILGACLTLWGCFLPWAYIEFWEIRGIVISPNVGIGPVERLMPFVINEFRSAPVFILTLALGAVEFLPALESRRTPQVKLSIASLNIILSIAYAAFWFWYTRTLGIAGAGISIGLYILIVGTLTQLMAVISKPESTRTTTT